MQSLCFMVMLAAVEPVPPLKLSRGQELVYSGKCTDDAAHDGGRFVKTYDLQVRLFVMESSNNHHLAALQTVVQPQSGDGGSARLDLVVIDGRGRLRMKDGSPVSIPLDGPPTVETAGVIERSVIPSNEREWGEMEPGRGPRIWGLAGDDALNGGRKSVLVGRQVSPNWDRPDERPAWRRLDTAWLGEGGIVQKLDRVIERRDPRIAGSRNEIRTKYELESSMVLPSSLADDRRREINQATQFHRLLQNAKPSSVDSLRSRIDAFVDRHPATPYRQGILGLRRRVEQLAHGETPTESTKLQPGPMCRLGEMAPDFAVAELPTGRMVHLQGGKNLCVVLAFVKPNSILGRASIDELRRLRTMHRDVYVAAALLDDVAAPPADLPSIDGRDLAASYVDGATPRFVVIGRNGVVSLILDGWGPETGTLLDRAVSTE